MRESKAVLIFLSLCVGLIAVPFGSDAQDAPQLVLPVGHTKPVSSVAFSPDGHYVLSGSWDTTIKLWEVETGREVRSFTGHPMAVTSVVFSPDGRYVLSSSDDTTLRLWEVSTGQEIRSFSGHTDNVSSVAFSPDGRCALSGSWDRTMKLWHVSTGKEELSIYVDDQIPELSKRHRGELQYPNVYMRGQDFPIVIPVKATLPEKNKTLIRRILGF